MPIALPQKIPLRWVLITPFVLTTIATVALVAYFSYRSGQEAVEDLAGQLVKETNGRVIKELETYLQTPLLINRLNVDAVNQKQLDLQNLPALESALLHRLQQFERVTAVLFTNPQGSFRVVDGFQGKFYLSAADRDRPNQLKTYRLNSQGKPEQLININNNLDVRRDRPWYKRAVTTGKPGWNPIFQYASFNTLTLNASQPVYDKTNKRLLGVFAVSIRLDYLSEFLNQLYVSRFGQVVIMDRKGTLIATSMKEQPDKIVVGSGVKSQFRQLKIYESRDKLIRSLGEYLRDTKLLTESLNKAENFEFSYNGKQQYVKITPYRDRYGLNWRIVTVIPKSHFMKGIQNNIQLTVLLCLLTLGLAMTLALIATEKVIARFRELNRASQELAAGNLAQRLPTDNSIEELNNLAKSFNQMADQLQQSFHRIQVALEESEKKFTTIFRTSPDPIAIVSLESGRILEINDSFVEFFGYSRNDIIDRTALELNIWHSTDQYNQYQALLRQQLNIRNLEIQLRTKFGEVKTVLLSAEVQSLEGQYCVSLLLRDISDRKLAEAARKESETRFRQLAEAVREGFFVYETETGKYSYINPAYEAIIGKNVDFLNQGMAHWLNRIHPDDRERIEAGLKRESQGENFNEEYRFFRLNGEISWLRSQAFPIRNQTGTIVRIVGIVEDITEQKQLEQSLRESEELFRNAFNNAPIGISIVSSTGQFIKANNYYCNLLEYTKEELLKLKFQDITHPADLEVDLEGFHQMLTGKIHSFQMQKRYITKQGTEISVLINVALVRDKNQQPLYLVGHIEDIRDRLKVERMKNEFISIISHELRTPLTSIRGALGLLNSGVFDDRPERAKRMLQIALNSSERLERLVNDILTLERLKSNKVQLVKEQYQIADLMQQAIETIQAVAEQTGVTLCVKPIYHTIMVAPDAVIQTFTNLLSNAIKFSSVGDTVWLSAEIIEQWKNDNHPIISCPSILFTVKDQGRGIPYDKLEVIFEQFQQVDVSDSRNKGGTGLGLAICKKIVQQHGGKIWVKSVLGEGSTFYFTLPLTIKEST
ncbi:MAG: PAS domain S-box protein [Phormidium sp.]